MTLKPLIGALVSSVIVAGCMTPTLDRTVRDPGTQPRSAQSKALTVGIATGVSAMGIIGGSSTLGGWGTVSELHSDGLITADMQSRALVGRLAEAVPTIESGSISVLPDGRMRVVYRLRSGIVWQDGTPFTADDLVFSVRMIQDPGIPAQISEGVNFMDTSEAVDARTWIVYFKAPYYLGGTLGLRRFWPQPRHLLEEAFQRYRATGNVDEVVHLPYWTSQYVHVGPFRLTSFDPGEGSVYEAHPGYFLGRPKIDTVRVRTFSDPNVLFSSALAGAVDIVADTALNTDTGYELKARWESAAEGTVHVRPGGTRFLALQWRSAVQIEPANLDPRVRAALYGAIDRESLSEGLPYKEQPAWSILPPGDRLYDVVKDGLRRHPYDPERAKASLREAGWTPGSDGILRNTADGRRFRNAISTTAGSRYWEMAVYADSWRRIGLDVDEITIPASLVRNLEHRANFPGWEPSSSGAGDSLLGRLEGPAATAENRWTGERGGYEDPRAQRLLGSYYASLSEPEQLRTMRAISDFIVAELPLLITYYNTDHIGVRKGIRAMDDVAGGAQAGQPYGTYTRNSHLWDMD